jgi:8-oxo-dGTP pyrophosphatase MutT (NUDIX family)
MFGAAMVIIQDATHKIVVVHDTRKGGWFFPRGRKDVGESLEEAALREGYEEVRHGHCMRTNGTGLSEFSGGL